MSKQTQRKTIMPGLWVPKWIKEELEKDAEKLGLTLAEIRRNILIEYYKERHERSV